MEEETKKINIPQPKKIIEQKPKTRPATSKNSRLSSASKPKMELEELVDKKISEKRKNIPELGEISEKMPEVSNNAEIIRLQSEIDVMKITVKHAKEDVKVWFLINLQ